MMDDGVPLSAFRLGEWVVRPAELTITDGSIEHRLETKVMDVLLALAAAGGEVVTREILIDKVWGTEFGGDESLSRAISLLRKALGDAHGNHRHIRTIPRKGYRLIAEVSELDAAARPAVRDLPAETPSVVLQDPANEKRATQAGGSFLKLAIAAAAGIAVVLAVWLAWPRTSGGDDLETVTVELVFKPNTFLILPFETNSEADAQKSLAASLPGALARTFARNSLVVSLAQENVVQTDTQEFIISGSVSEAADNVAVNIDVTDAASGVKIWATTYERPASEIDLLENIVIVDTANILQDFVAARSRYRDVNSPELLSLVLRGSELGTGEAYDVHKLPRNAEQILEKIPDDPEAIAQVASAYAVSTWRPVPPDELSRIQSKIYDLVEQVLEVDPNNGGALWAKAVMKDQSVSIAEREQYLLQILEHDPEWKWSKNHLGHLYAGTGRLKDSVFFYEKFVFDHPLDFRRGADLILATARAGNLEFARSQIDDLRREFPQSTQKVLQRAFTIEFQYGDAKRMREISKMLPGWIGDSPCIRTITQALAVDETLSPAMLEEQCSDVMNTALVLAYMRFGHVDEVFDWLDSHADKFAATFAYTQRGRLFGPDFAPVRADPRFMPYAARIGLVDYWTETGHWPDFCESEDLPYDCETAALAALESLEDG